MSSSKSANAVLAKARAKYGRRLSEKDYTNLLACKSVSEVVTYLKNNTYYETVLRKVNEREIHRGQLEIILKQKLFEDFYSLCLYTKGSGEHFAEFILQRDEIEQIIHFLTLLSSNSSHEYIFSMPQYFSKHTSINAASMARARTYEQFFASLAGTPYEKLLAEFKPSKGERINIARVEDKLYKYCYRNLYESIEKYSSGAEQKALRSMFDSIMDYFNFVRVFRLKKYYKESPDVTASYLFPYGTFSAKTVKKLCAAQTSAEVFDAVKNTSFGRNLSKLEYAYAGEIDKVGLFKLTKKNIHFSSYPLVVMLSYIFVMQTEYNNVVSIIEGVRYNVDSSKIETIIIT